jgi:phage terminase large subunit-like protein
MEVTPCPSCGELFVGVRGASCPECMSALDGLIYDLDGMVRRSDVLQKQALAKAVEMVTPFDSELTRECELIEKSLGEFVRGSWHVLEPANPYVEGWHLGCIYEHLEAISRREIRNLVINIPPRHQKSLATCVFWFCWRWIVNPESRWMFASYADSLALRDSVKCKDVINSDWYQLRWGNRFLLRKGEGAQSKFSNDRKGYRLSTSVGGRGIGEGADVIVVDDPHKAHDVFSETMRTKVLRWWSETMSTRGNDPATVCKVITMQRLHERDLAGHVIAENLGYEHLVLPARYEPKRYFFTRFDVVEAVERGEATTRDAIVMTVLQRMRPDLRDGPGGSGRTEDSQPLWPERYGDAELKILERELDAYGTAGQLQQRPAPAEGDVFKRTFFRSFREESLEFAGMIRQCFIVPSLLENESPYIVPREWCRVFQTCDTAMKRTASACYTAVLTCAMAPIFDGRRLVGKLLLILDVWREKLAIPEQYPALLALRASYPDILMQYVEDKSSGTGILAQGEADGVPFGALKPGSDDKAARAAAISTLYRDRLVCHRDGMPRRVDYEDELLSFPSGQYDDLVDCASYAGIVFIHDTLLNAPLNRPLITGIDEESRRLEAINSGQLVEIDGGATVAFSPDDRPWWEP